MTTRKIQVVGFTLLVIAAFGIYALAGSTNGAHFMSFGSSVIDSAQLAVTFDEAGLGNGNIDYTLTANARYFWGCLNGGSNHPQATNKETTETPVSGGGSFQSKNGRVSATVLAPTNVPIMPTNFSCPSGQIAVLAYAAYSNIVLTDTNNTVTIYPASVSRTFFQFKK